MRALVSYALVLLLIIGPVAHANDEIEFNPDPIVTVELEPDSKLQPSYIVPIIAVSGIAFIAFSFLLCRR